MNLRVVLDEGARMPERAHETDAGADLFTPRYAFVKSGQSTVIDTGVHIEILMRWRKLDNAYDSIHAAGGGR